MSCKYEIIRNENIKEYGEGTRHLAFLGQLYKNRTHFIFELLQNAEDAGASSVLFELFEDRLEVKHNGRLFSENDVRGVCGVGEGTKKGDLTQIGRFGIGFKSVYAYTDSPEIHSGNEHFSIKSYVRPYKALKEVDSEKLTTLFIFAFNSLEIDTKKAHYEIAERLRNLSSRTLLFLREIEEIEYKLTDKTEGFYIRESTPNKLARNVTVTCQNKGHDEEEKWLIFERFVTVPDGNNQVRVEIAFKLEFNADNQTKNIVKLQRSPLFVYFPTEEYSRLGFLLQGPYRTTPSRHNIPVDDDWNKKLIEETSLLLIDSLQSLKKMGLLTVSLLNALPVRKEDFPDDKMFEPIFTAVRNTLMEQELLPTNDGEFIFARNAKLANTEWLRNLIGTEQLKLLFNTEHPLKWITGEIALDLGTQDLYKYFRDYLNIEQILPENFVKMLDVSFLEKQTDEWITTFYQQLSSSSRALWQPNGPLRAKPFIRLQDGSHVNPFSENGSPRVYLPPVNETVFSTVKREIANDKAALEFLVNLGLREPSVITEVLEIIIPKYNTNDLNISEEMHMKDMKKIFYAYCYPSSPAEKTQLMEKLKETRFVRAENIVLKKTRFKKPSDLYFQTEDLLFYFESQTEAWFVYSEYDKIYYELFKELEIVDVVRIKRQISESGHYVTIQDENRNHIRGLDGFDPGIEVDGLEYALKNPTINKSAFIWNKIAIPNSDCISGFIEYSKQKSYEKSKTLGKIESGKFGKLLINYIWLPDKLGKFYKPSEIEPVDIHELFLCNEKLAEHLGMKNEEVKRVKNETGRKLVPAEEYEEFKEFQKKKQEKEAKKHESNEYDNKEQLNAVNIDYEDELENVFNRPGETELLDQNIDDGVMRNPDRRRDKSYAEHKENFLNEPSGDKRREKTIRNILEGPSDQVREYLLQMYGGKCQLCGETFLERNGRAFFIANYIVPRKLARFADTPANALCLCANHFAKWQHGTRTIDADNVSDQIRNLKTGSEGGTNKPILKIKLCGEELKIEFNEKHLVHLQELLNASKNQVVEHSSNITPV